MTLIELCHEWLTEEKPKDKFSQAVDDTVTGIKNHITARKYRGAINTRRPESPKGAEAKKRWVAGKARRIGLPT